MVHKLDCSDSVEIALRGFYAKARRLVTIIESSAGLVLLSNAKHVTTFVFFLVKSSVVRVLHILRKPLLLTCWLSTEQVLRRI